jgi:multiple sugar transport system ATP-binding protein
VSFLEIKELKKTYPDGTQAVKGIDLAIDEGEFIVLLGPSGCGKTTTLRMVAGLEIPTAGAIVMGGEDVTSRRPSARDVGFVFQFYALYPHMSVRENIAFPLRNIGFTGPEVNMAVGAVAERLGLGKLLKLYPPQLSGGDQQRVSLARAMVRKPKIYLMDEPLGTLDADLRQEMREFIRAQQLEMKVTTIYVTHDQEEAMGLADRIVVMEAGGIRQAGSPGEVYDKPADLFVANFVGSPGMNFIPGEIKPRGESGVFVPEGCTSEAEIACRARSGKATLGIRPEFVEVDEAGPLKGTVVMDEYQGSSSNLHVDATFGQIIARSTGARRSPGENVGLSFSEDHVRVFDPDSGRSLV